MKYFNLPDGSQIAVDDDVTLDEATRRARAKFPELYRTAKEDAKGGMLANAWQGAKESLGDLGISYSALTGDTKEARGKISERDIAGSAVRTTNFDDVIEAFKKPSEEGGGIGAGIKGIGSLVTENLGRSLGYMGPGLATGALAARGLAMTPLAPVAAPVAAGLTALQMMQAYAGSNLARQQQERGQDVPFDIGAAQLAGAGQAALDLGSFLGVIGKQGIKLVSGVPLDVIKRMSAEQLQAQVVKDAALSLGRGAAKGVGKGLLFEMPTEAAQQVLERAQAGLGWDPLNKEVVEAGLMGGIIGGGMGALGGYADTRAAKRAVALQDKVKGQLEAAAQAKEEERGTPFLDDPETVLQASAYREKLLAEKKQLEAQRKALGTTKEDPSIANEQATLDERAAEIRSELKRLGPLVRTEKLAQAQEYMRTKGMSPEEYATESSGMLPTAPPRPVLKFEEQQAQRAAQEAAMSPEERELLGMPPLPQQVVPKVGPATEAYLRQLEDPYQVEAIRQGREKLDPKDARAWLVRNPDFAEAVLSGQESFPGIDPTNATQQKLNRDALVKELQKAEAEAAKYEAAQAEALKQSAYATLSDNAQVDLAEQVQNYVNTNGPAVVYGTEQAASVMSELKRNVLPRHVARALGLRIAPGMQAKNAPVSLDFNDTENAAFVLSAAEEKLPELKRKLQQDTERAGEAPFKKKEAAFWEAAQTAARLQEIQRLIAQAKAVLADPAAQQRATESGALRVVEGEAARAEAAATRAAGDANASKVKSDALASYLPTQLQQLKETLLNINNGEGRYTAQDLDKLRQKIVSRVSQYVNAERTARKLPPLTKTEEEALIKVDGLIRQLVNASTPEHTLDRSKAEQAGKNVFARGQARARNIRNSAETQAANMIAASRAKPEHVQAQIRARAEKIVAKANRRADAALENAAKKSKQAYDSIKGTLVRTSMTRGEYANLVDKGLGLLGNAVEKMLAYEVPTTGNFRKAGLELTADEAQPAWAKKAEPDAAVEASIEAEAFGNAPERVPGVGAKASLSQETASVLQKARQRLLAGNTLPEIRQLVLDIASKTRAGLDTTDLTQELQQKLDENTRASADSGINRELFPPDQLPSLVTAEDTPEKFQRGLSPNARFPGGKALPRQSGALEMRARLRRAQETRTFRAKLRKLVAPLRKFAEPAMSDRPVNKTVSETKDVETRLRAVFANAIADFIDAVETATFSRASFADIGQRATAVLDAESTLNELRVTQQTDVGKAAQKKLKGFKEPTLTKTAEALGAVQRVLNVINESYTPLNERILAEELEYKRRIENAADRDVSGGSPRSTLNARQKSTPTLTDVPDSRVGANRLDALFTKAATKATDARVAEEFGLRDTITVPEVAAAHERLAALPAMRVQKLAPGAATEIETQAFFDEDLKPLPKEELRPKFYVEPKEAKKRGRPSKAAIEERAQRLATDRAEKRVETVEVTPRSVTQVSKNEPYVYDETREEVAKIQREVDRTPVNKDIRITPAVEYLELGKAVTALRKGKSPTTLQKQIILQGKSWDGKETKLKMLQSATLQLSALRNTINPDTLRTFEAEGVVPKLSISEKARRARDAKLRATYEGKVADKSPPGTDAGILAAQLRGNDERYDFRTRSESGSTATGTIDEADYAGFDAPNSVTMVWDPSESPSLVRAAEEAGIPLDEVQGVTLPDGTIVVAGKNHASLRSLEETVAHEIGHERTNSYLGVDGYEKFVRGRTLMEIGAVAKDLGATDAADAMARATGEFDKKRAGVSEIFAKLNEGIPYESLTARVKRFVNEWIGAAREWLRSTGFFELAKLRESDLYYILSKAKKSGVPVREMVDTDVDFTAENAVPVTQRGWFSALRRAVESIPSKAMPAQEWAKAIGSLTTKGVKPAEIQWSGIGEWLAEQPGKVSKNEVLTFLEQNDIRLSTDGVFIPREDLALTTHELKDLDRLQSRPSNQLTSEQRERLDELQDRASIEPDESGPPWAHRRYPGPVEAYGTFLVQLDPASGSKALKNPEFVNELHWKDAKNVLGHVRYTVRKAADGKRVLFVEEAQSDWGQTAQKEGYFDPEREIDFSVVPNEAGQKLLADAERFARAWLYSDYVVSDFDDNTKGKYARPFSNRSPEEYRKLEDSRKAYVALQRKLGKYQPITFRVYADGKYNPDHGALEVTLLEFVNSQGDYKKITTRARSIQNMIDGVERAVRTAGVDRAPFIDKTDNWVPLLLKRVLHGAATNPDIDVDYVAFPDAEQAKMIENHDDLRLKKFYEEIVPKNFERVVKQTLGVTPEKIDVEVDAAGNPGTLRAYKLTPEMKAKAAEGMPMFRRRSKLTEDEQRIVNRTQAKMPGIWDAIVTNLKGPAFRTQFIDRWDSFLRLVEQKYDLAKTAGERAAAIQAQVWARAADSQSSFANVAMSEGVPAVKEVKNRDGTSNWLLEANGPSLKDVFEALGKDPLDLYNAYRLAIRAENVGYDTIYGEDTPEIRADAAAARQWAKKYPSFLQADKLYNEYNKNLVNLLAASGYISQQSADRMASKNDYVPAYRHDKSTDDVMLVYGSEAIKIGNVRYQPDLAPLKGSDQRILPFLDSSIINTRALIGHALTNLAAKESAFTLGSLNLGRILPADTKNLAGRNIIHFRQNGVPKAFVLDFSKPKDGVQVDDISPDLLVTGMEGVSVTIPAFVRMMQPFSRALRYGVTRMPTYALRQLARDPMAAWLVSGTNFNPVTDTLGRLGKTLRNADDTVQLLRKRGGTGGLIYEGDNETIKRQIKWLTNDPNMFAKLWKAADKLAVDSDAVTRANVYDAAIRDGKTEAQAYLASIESMNFGQHGTSRGMFLLNMTVPFLRAQINGMDTIYKSLSGRMSLEDKLKTRQEMLTRGLMIAAATTLYALSVGDEDWYKQLKPEERYNFVHFKLPGVDEPIKLPIPFELGLVFKALPEALIDIMRGDEEFDDAVDGMRKLVFNMVPNPTPQMIKPALEVMLNRSMFTGQPVEPVSTKDLPMEERAGPRTPEIIKALAPQMELLGKDVGLSPAQLEYLIRGYFGPMGVAITNLVDASLGLSNLPEGVEAPERKLSQNPVFGSMFQRLEGQNVIDKAYRMTEKFSQQAKSYKKAAEEGDIERLQEFAENPQKLAYAKMDESGRTFRRKMAELKKTENMVRRGGGTPQEKAEMIENLNQVRATMARQMFMQSKAIREATAP